MRELMARVAADVWVLTETHRDFAPGADFRLVASSANAPDRHSDRGETWVAIWSRQPSEGVESVADPERACAARLVTAEVGEIMVVGTVLPWLSDTRDPTRRGTQAFLVRLREQAADWRRYCARSGTGVVVAGDFNQDLLPVGHYYGSAVGRQCLRSELGDAGLVCLTGGEDDPLACERGFASIDHICVGGGVTPAGRPASNVWPVPGTLSPALTDHYGVWADVTR
jgi:hypothetical protein